MADMDLFCNNKKCRKRLTTCAWITSCSHAFCDEDADHAFFSTESNITCPACSSHLPEKHDIVKVDLNPPDKFKSMVLAGLRPEIVMDVTNRALTFWHYQMHQELQYQKAINKRSCDNLTQAEEMYTTEIMKLNAVLQKEKRNKEALEKEVENQARQLGQLQDQIVQKNRQLQNLMALNNKLRCNTTSSQPDDNYDVTKPKRSNYSLGPTTLKDIRPTHDEVYAQNASGRPQASKNFVFNPVTPPLRSDEKKRTFLNRKQYSFTQR